MDVATEEIGHVEMMAIMVVRLLEGAPATATAHPQEEQWAPYSIRRHRPSLT
jgi:Mn-containing catalase